MADRTLNVKITGDPRSLNRALGQSTNRLRLFGRQVNSATSSLKGLAFSPTAVVAGVAALGFGLNRAVGSAREFEAAMRNVNSIARLSDAEFESLSNQVRKLAPGVGKGPTELAQGLYDIVSSGFTAADALKVLDASAKAATAGLTTTATATRAVSAVLNAYHLQADEARKVSDLLFQEVNLGVNTFEDLAQNLGDVVPQAAALKIPFEQVGAALATITLGGTNIAEASTQVGRILAQLVKPSEALAAEFRNLGYESGQAAVEALGFSGVIEALSRDARGNQQVLAEWLGDIRGIRGVINLTGRNLDTFREKVRQMGDATEGAGATSAAFAEQSKSLDFQLRRLGASAQSAATGLGNSMLPVIKEGASVLQAFANDTNRAALSLDDLVAQGREVAEVFGTAGLKLVEFANGLKQAQAIRAPGEGGVRIEAGGSTTSAGGATTTGGGATATTARPSLVRSLPNKLVQSLLDAQIAGSQREILKALQAQSSFLTRALSQRRLNRAERTDLKESLIAVNDQIRAINDAIAGQLKTQSTALKKVAKDTEREVARLSPLDRQLQRLDQIQSARDAFRSLRDARTNLVKQLRIGGAAGIQTARDELADAQLQRRRLALQGVTFTTGAGRGGGFSQNIGQVTININGANQDPEKIAQRVAAVLRRRAKHNASQPRGRSPGEQQGFS